MMRIGRWLVAGACVEAAVSSAGCKGGADSEASNSPRPAQPGAAPAAASAPAGEAGVEKVRPAPGTGNVQGKVLYNGKPVENIEVRLCETFNRYSMGEPCGGKTYTARTDRDGDYVVANVEPRVYEGLLVSVFDTDSYVFATAGLGISASKYEVAADKTLFVRPTSIFKGDLKVVNPKAGSRVSAQGLELRWEPYPDAAYYKFSIYPDEVSAASPYVNRRVDGTSFAVDQPLQNGTYRLEVEAYNGADQKLSESSSDIKFTIAGGAPS